MLLYKDEQNGGPCRIFREYRYIPTSTLNNNHLPWLYYGEGDASILLNRKKIETHYSIFPNREVSRICPKIPPLGFLISIFGNFFLGQSAEFHGRAVRVRWHLFGVGDHSRQRFAALSRALQIHGRRIQICISLYAFVYVDGSGIAEEGSSQRIHGFVFAT